MTKKEMKSLFLRKCGKEAEDIDDVEFGAKKHYFYYIFKSHGTRLGDYYARPKGIPLESVRKQVIHLFARQAKRTIQHIKSKNIS